MRFKAQGVSSQSSASGTASERCPFYVVHTVSRDTTADGNGTMGIRWRGFGCCRIWTDLLCKVVRPIATKNFVVFTHK